MSTVSDRILRDRKRYTGDGLPNEPTNAPLPFGDPQSGAHTATLAEWREVFNVAELAGAAATAERIAAEAAAALALAYASDAVSQGNVPIYGSAAAVAGYEVAVGITAFQTNGYAAAGDGGGTGHARYVYTGTTGPVELGGIADASTPTRYFRLACERVNVRTFGATGGGVIDDHDAIQDAFTFATTFGLPVYIPQGIYLIDSATDSVNAIEIVGTVDVKVLCEGTILAGIGILDTIVSGSGRIIRFSPTDSAVENTTQKFEWYGGIIDGSALPAVSPGLGSLVIGPKADITIHGVLFNNGTSAPSGVDFGGGGGDTGFFAKEFERLSITSCTFVGFANDSGIYLSGDDGAGRRGVAGYIVGNRFRRCNNAVIMKRRCSHIVVDGNFVEECNGGIMLGMAGGLDNQGTRVVISGNTILKSQGIPIGLAFADYCLVSGNIIIDWKRWISDGTTETGVSTGNYGGGIKLDGCRLSIVSGNTVGYEEWTPVSTASKQSYGVAIQGHQLINTTYWRSEYVLVEGNVFKGLFGGVILNSETQFCKIGANVYAGMLNSNIIDAGVSNKVENFGTFLPNVVGTTSNLGSGAYDYREGVYKVRGDECTAWVYVDLAALTSLSGAVTITGLPFISAGSPNLVACAVHWQGMILSAGATTVQAAVDRSTQIIRLFEVGSNLQLPLTQANFTTNSRLAITATYPVAI